MIWQSKVPPRVAFFSWSASLGKILTTNNLRKQRVLVLDWCYMCKNCEESMDHLLLHCPIACELCSLVLCLFGIHWVMPHKAIELFESWQGMFGRHRNTDLWRIVPHCLLWCIWRKRNARSFEGCERSMLEIKSFFFYTLSLIGVWSFVILLVLPFPFYLIIVILAIDLCPHSTFPMYSSWLFFVTYQKKFELQIFEDPKINFSTQLKL